MLDGKIHAFNSVRKDHDVYKCYTSGKQKHEDCLAVTSSTDTGRAQCRHRVCKKNLLEIAPWTCDHVVLYRESAVKNVQACNKQCPIKQNQVQVHHIYWWEFILSSRFSWRDSVWIGTKNSLFNMQEKKKTSCHYQLWSVSSLIRANPAAASLSSPWVVADSKHRRKANS